MVAITSEVSLGRNQILLAISVQVEVFNLTNAVQWPAPNTNVTATAFGTVSETQANDPRFVQIAFRLIF